MREECVEENADRLTARRHAEGVEEYDEEEFCGARETDGEYRENAEDEGCSDFKRYFVGEVGNEESCDAICPIVVFFVEDVALERVDAHVLKHPDKNHFGRTLSAFSPVWLD